MLLLPILVTLALVGIAMITVLNTLTFPRLAHYHRANQKYQGSDLPLVSVLIPARNEAGNLGLTIRQWLGQDYPGLEVLVLDDHSTDGTAEVARAAAAGDTRLKVFEGMDLPDGWSGKNWACHQLSQRASGELLVFTDADVRWATGALRSLVNFVQSQHADMATIWPTQWTVTWAERLVVPLMALAIIGYLPLLAVHFIPWPVFSAANGQCLVFRRSVYQAVGGHVAVGGSVIEDIDLARRTKRKGFRLRMGDGAELIACRMYSNWMTVRDGYAKNILAGHGNRISFLLLSTLFHWLVFIAPWIWLAFGWIDLLWPLQQVVAWPIWPLALIVLGVGVRALSAAATRQRARDALWMPISALLMTIVAGQAIWWRWRYGGTLWKGRTISASHKQQDLNPLELPHNQK